MSVPGVCERLWVTKGSFYHHFSTMTGFVQALAREWESTSIALLNACAAEPDSRRRSALICRDYLTLPHPAWRAWHAWGRTQPSVGEALRRVEQHAENLFAATLADLLGDVERAATLADMGGVIAIGLRQHEPPLEPETVAALVLEWIRRCLGHDAEVVMENSSAELMLTPRG